MHFLGDPSNQSGTNLYGCFKQFYLLKKQNRNLKVLLSIGGSTYSSNFAIPASTTSGRSTFASTAVSLVANLGLDGLDINWEYPVNSTEASNMVLLLQAIREALDAYGNSLTVPYNFTLTVASPAGPSNYQVMQLANIDQYIDFWNVMAYDYAGSWSAVAADQANLFMSGSNAAATPFNTQTAIDYYISQGIAANKIVLGMPVYGRSFEATEGLGEPFDGVGNGTWEAGIYDFKALPLSGAVVLNDNITGSSHSYDATKKELVSYDTVAVAKQKAVWIQYIGLGGAMWWESSADGTGSNSLIQSVVELLGGGSGSNLQSSPNQLLYPNSTYDNLRAGMPGSSSVWATPISSTSISEACLCTSSSTSGVFATPLPSSSSSATTSIMTMSSGTSITSTGLFTSSTTESSLYSKVSSTETTTGVGSGQSSPSSSTTTLMVPGKNGVPGCAYVLASDLGPGALCSSDYCDCGGTAAPLLTSSVMGTFSRNCNYQTQPAANSCPPPATSPSTSTAISTFPGVTLTKVVVITCTTYQPTPESCRTVTTSVF
jgi:chitinase